MTFFYLLYYNQLLRFNASILYTGDIKMRRLIQVFKPSSLALHWKGPIKEEDLFKWLFEYMFTYKAYKCLISVYHHMKHHFNQTRTDIFCQHISTKRRWMPQNFLAKPINEKPKDTRKVLYTQSFLEFYNHYRNSFISSRRKFLSTFFKVEKFP